MGLPESPCELCKNVVFGSKDFSSLLLIVGETRCHSWELCLCQPGEKITTCGPLGTYFVNKIGLFFPLNSA